MNSDQRWRLLRPTIFLFLLPYNMTLGLCFGTEALALMKFKEKIERDPFGALMNWEELPHCSWFGVMCSSDGRVVNLNLQDLSLHGTLAPELGNLTHLKSLILRNNSFSGKVPEEVTDLQELEILDLCDNNFGQSFPFARSLLQIDPPGKNPDVSAAPPLPREDDIIDPFLTPPSLNRSESPLFSPSTETLTPPLAQPPPPDQPPPPAQPPSAEPPPPVQPPSPAQITSRKKGSHKIIIIVGVLVGVFVIVAALVAFFLLRNEKMKLIKPREATGSTGQLQDIVVTTGVPKLKLSELETACEDFSNIIGSTSSNATIYKGTLSTGTEIAVLAVASGSIQDWSLDHEAQFQEKIQMLSQVSHKNFLNVIGYCHENEPFNRMLVLEYAPNGSLFEHLHDQDAEHLDWPMRLRITMGIAYCLEHMHNLNPKPISPTNLNSSSVYLATDYAAKVADFTFLSSTPHDPITNVSSFGTLLHEIITGKIPDPDVLLHNETKPVVDPTLKSFDESVMERLWEVVRECLSKKLEMKEVVVKLREITGITAEAALPSRSPAWWAELEIISSEM